MIDLNELFRNSNSDWIKYSDYEYRATSSGELYLLPTEDAEVGMVNPLSDAENLLIDALNIGKLCIAEQPDMPAIKVQILTFAKQYGLLGFMTAYPLKLDFIEKREVLLNANPITEKSVMKTEDYLKYFLPFGSDTAVWGDGKNTAVVESSVNPFMFVMDRPPVYQIVFSKWYAEKFDWLFGAFKRWYVHLGACHYYDKTDNDTLRKLHIANIQTFAMQGLSYRIKLIKTPSIVLEFPALKTAVDALYSFHVADSERPLRICKHCGKAFLAKNLRAEFCSVPCRNQFNVYKGRKKEK